MKIQAVYIPQATVNDYYVDIDDPIDFEVELTVEEALKILEVGADSEEADDLWYRCPLSKEDPYDGPFRIQCISAIEDALTELGIPLPGDEELDLDVDDDWPDDEEKK